jgi:single-strand DNA-binding protein
MFNQVTLVGSLGQDAEARELKNGGKVVNFNMATNQSYKDKETGEYKDITAWHKVVIFNPAKVNFAEKAGRKGTLVLVQGEMKTRSYDNKSGDKVWVTEVIVPAYSGNFEVLSRPKNSESANESYPVTMSKNETDAQAKKDMIEDEILF